ncbi:MAG: DUF5069 domain-containing protein [Nitrospinaceae bacterium]
MATGPDLSKEFPRSPRQEMAGLVWVPRMLDKARASLHGQLGEYIFPCPMDKVVLEFLQIDADDFAKMAIGKTDAEIQSWIQQTAGGAADEKRLATNSVILEKKPDTPEKQEKFRRLRDAIDPTRPDIQTWSSLIDLEEGRS